MVDLCCWRDETERAIESQERKGDNGGRVSSREGTGASLFREECKRERWTRVLSLSTGGPFSGTIQRSTKRNHNLGQEHSSLALHIYRTKSPLPAGMASSTSVLSRTSSRFPSLIRSFRCNRMLKPDSASSSLTSNLQNCLSGRKTSHISRLTSTERLPSTLRCLGSMLPLHSAIASARLNSSLSAESQNWGIIPQGISMPL